MCSADIFLGLLAILFPPLPVWVKRGICSADSIINILLCVLGYIPGLLHAWYIIAKFPEADYEYGPVAGNDREAASRRAENHITYVYVTSDGRHHPKPPAGRSSTKLQKQPPPQAGMNYGTAASSSAPGAGNNGGEGSSNSASGQAPPPSYAQVVAGDNKVQSHD